MAAEGATTDLFARGLALFRERLAPSLGCNEADFDSHALTIVRRPAASREKMIVLTVTFGTGTVMSVDERFYDFARGLEFEKHYQAFNPQSFMAPMLDEARRLGIDVTARNPNLGFLLAREPAMPDAPAGLRFERWEKERAAPFAPTFENALWDAGEPHEDFLYALVLVDADGAPQAMAGAWHEEDGLIEIGVDVAHDARGAGLAPVIVGALARTILDSGSFPTYYCAATNVRSHRTALRSGFTPVVSASGVRPKPAPPTERPV